MKPAPTLKDLAELTAKASDPAKRAEIRESCFKLLTEDPGQPLLHLMLAKLFYLDGMIAFARREVEELCALYPTPSLFRLFSAMGGNTPDIKAPDLTGTGAGVLGNIMSGSGDSGEEPGSVIHNPSPRMDTDTATASINDAPTMTSAKDFGIETTVAEVDLDEEFLAALEDFKE